MKATLPAVAAFSLLAASAYAADLGPPLLAPPVPPLSRGRAATQVCRVAEAGGKPISTTRP
jgi:hypothetical protein